MEQDIKISNQVGKLVILIMFREVLVFSSLIRSRAWVQFLSRDRMEVLPARVVSGDVDES